MTESLTHEVIAIDGGGTRCRVALHDGRTTTTVETGSANVSTDFDGAVREILAGLDALALRSGRSAQNLLHLPTFLGLAGVTGTEIAQRLRAALPLHNVRIEDDRPAALRGALGAADGVIAHCGTGSFYAAQKGTEMRFAGGWGPVLGDEASAQWIGRAVLRMTLECVDGRAQVSPLAERMLDDLGGSAGVVSFAGSARPTDFGALAPLVTGYAEQGDLIACAVMQDGADHIARSLPKVGWGDGQPICLTGGIGPHFARFLPAEMQAALSDPVGEPLSGAISLARGLALETADERR
jgi:glucosamine kinase